MQKLTNAIHLSFAERALLQEQNVFLTRVNNEAKVRRSTKSEIIGTARVMTFKDLERVRTVRREKEAEKAAKKARNKARKIVQGISNLVRARAGEESYVIIGNM